MALMKKRIHVNRHHVAYNKKHRNDPDFTPRPPITVKTYKGSTPKPSSPLSCGAEIWIETGSDIYIGSTNEVI
jgi:hypothetical protein